MAWTRKATVTVPSRQGWVAIVLLVSSLAVVILLGIMPYLAPTSPVGEGVLVVEGWLPVEMAEQVVQRYSDGRYAMVVTTAEHTSRPPYHGHFSSPSELAAETLVNAGIPDSSVFAVPAPLVTRDRTYASALAVKSWLDSLHSGQTRRIDVLSMGPHARRSRLLFQLAFGDDVDVGVIALPEGGYDPSRWWKSSAGVRSVVGEAVAYAYAKWLFWP